MLGQLKKSIGRALAVLRTWVGQAAAGALGQSTPADTGKGTPGARILMPRAQSMRCFPAWLQLPLTIQLQPYLAKAYLAGTQ